MTTDLILAIVHHILVFGLVAIVLAEALLLGMGAERLDIPLLSKLDARYGMIGMGVLLVGTARVVWGVKGWGYYQDNPWFWAKIACFFAAGLLSIPPTIRFVRWRRAHKADAGFRPDPREVGAAHRLVGLQGVLLILVMGFAATMARFT